MLSTKSLTLYLLLCLELAVANSKIVFNKTENYNSRDIEGINYASPGKDIRNSLMAIVSCQSTGDSVANCTISLTDLNSNNEPLQCDFEFNHDIVNQFTWHPYTADKAILVTGTWTTSAEHYVNYTIINFADCKTNILRIDFKDDRVRYRSFEENRDAIILNDDGTFDIFYNDAKTCGKKLCRLTINSEGKKINGPTPSFVPLIGTYYRTIKKLKSSPTLIVQEQTPRSYKVSLVKPDGQLILREHGDAHNMKYESIFWNGISTSHGLIRLCNLNSTEKVDCVLFDYDTGKSTSNVSVEVSGKVAIVKVENLANGEFLLMPEKIDYTESSLMKIKNDGSVGGVVHLNKFESCNFYLDAYESHINVSNNQYCVTRKCFKPETSKMLSVMKECYGDSDFH